MKRILFSQGQFLMIVLGLCYFSGAADAQFVWQITDTTSGRYYANLYDLSCKGGSCSAVFRYVQRQSPYQVLLMLKSSTDYGRTWLTYDPDIHLQNDPSFLADYEVDQIDSLNAIAVADSAIIVKTSDGGKTWKQIPSPLWHFYDVSFSDP